MSTLTTARCFAPTTSRRPLTAILVGATVATLAFGAAAAAQAQTNLLTNGSFENTNDTFANNGAGGDSLAIGSTAITGWTTTNAELAWLVNQNNYSLAPEEGSYFLDLTGYHDSSPYGGVTQSIATTVGASYTLSFYLGCNEGFSNTIGPVSAMASAGSASQSFTFTPSAGAADNVYAAFSLPFTATSNSTAITITGTASAGGTYIGLDNATVVANSSGASAPEPSALLLLAPGVMALLGLIAANRCTVSRDNCKQ